MKWFKHFSDSYSNIKHQQILADYGLKGYGFYWVCLELVAQQGVDFKIGKEKNWKKVLARMTYENESIVNQYLDTFADVDLIDKTALKQGILYLPKMEEYSDEYTNKVRRLSGQGTDKVVLDKNRLDKNRLDKNRLDKRRAPLTSRIYYLSQLPEEDIQEFIKRFEINEKALKSKAEDLKLYVEGRGRQTYYKNFKSVLLNALKRDFKEREVRKPVTKEKEIEQTPKQKSLIQKSKDKINKKYNVAPIKS